MLPISLGTSSISVSNLAAEVRFRDGPFTSYYLYSTRKVDDSLILS